MWGAKKVPMPLQVTIWTNGGVSMSEVPAVFAMKSGSKIGTCGKIRLPYGGSFLGPHLFDLKGTVSMSSDTVSQNFGSFLCSD